MINLLRSLVTYKQLFSEHLQEVYTLGNGGNTPQGTRWIADKQKLEVCYYVWCIWKSFIS